VETFKALKQTNQCSNGCFVAKGPDGLPHKVTHNIHIEFRQYSTFIDAPVVAIIPTEAYIAACLHASRPHGHRRITDAWSGPNWALTIHHIGFKRLWECVSQGAPKWAKKLQPSQPRDVFITTPCRHQYFFNSSASRP
jgi:hypothetical protein